VTDIIFNVLPVRWEWRYLIGHFVKRRIYLTIVKLGKQELGLGWSKRNCDEVRMYCMQKKFS